MTVSKLIKDKIMNTCLTFVEGAMAVTWYVFLLPAFRIAISDHTVVPLAVISLGMELNTLMHRFSLRDWDGTDKSCFGRTIYNLVASHR